MKRKEGKEEIKRRKLKLTAPHELVLFQPHVPKLQTTEIPTF